MTATDSTPTPTPVLPGPAARGPEHLARRRWFSILAAVALLAAVVGVVALIWPRDSQPPPASPSAGETGEGAIGTAPDPATPGAGVNPGASVSARASATASGSADPSVTASGPAASGLVASRSVPDGYGLVQVTVEITVTNLTRTVATWHSVGLILTGSVLGVSSADPGYTYEAHGSTHCFLPATGSQSVAPGGSSTFSVKVMALLPGALTKADTTPVDTAPCPT